MSQKTPEEMENSELLTYFLISRDNLISLRRALFEKKDDKELNDLFNLESKNNDNLLKEIYRRMNYGR